MFETGSSCRTTWKWTCISTALLVITWISVQVFPFEWKHNFADEFRCDFSGNHRWSRRVMYMLTWPHTCVHIQRRDQSWTWQQRLFDSGNDKPKPCYRQHVYLVHFASDFNFFHSIWQEQEIYFNWSVSDLRTRWCETTAFLKRHRLHLLRGAHARPVDAEPSADHEASLGSAILTWDSVSIRDPPKVSKKVCTHKCFNGDCKSFIRNPCNQKCWCPLMPSMFTNNMPNKFVQSQLTVSI